MAYSVSSCGQSFAPCPRKEQNEFPFGEVSSPLSVRCWGCCVLFPAVLPFPAAPRARLGLAVVLGSVKGFHQARGERVCPPLAGGTAGTVQPRRLSGVQATRVWHWDVLRKALLCGASCPGQLRAHWGLLAAWEAEEQGHGAHPCYLYISPGSSQANSCSCCLCGPQLYFRTGSQSEGASWAPRNMLGMGFWFWFFFPFVFVLFNCV